MPKKATTKKTSKKITKKTSQKMTKKTTKKAVKTKKEEIIDVPSEEGVLFKEDKPSSRMQVCEVCGEQRADVMSCRMCGTHFCGDDGYPENHLCFSCGDEVEETSEDTADENLTESGEPEPSEEEEFSSEE